ncbi:MAG: spore protease YyaC [Tissierellia bacterium]|nr:spore protease YyaC [Tissierellia bacterium]
MSNSFNSDDINCLEDYINGLREYIKEYDINKHDALVIVNIGTDRATGDALAPIVGNKLKDLKLKNVCIYGNLDNPVHAKNLDKTLNEIHNKFINPFIIAIDACLGRLESSIGKITISKGTINPGAGVGKKLTPVGDISIVGIVNIGGCIEMMVLQNTRLSFVMKLANIIADGLAVVLREMFETEIIEEIAVDKEQGVEVFSIKEFLHKILSKKVKLVF